MQGLQPPKWAKLFLNCWAKDNINCFRFHFSFSFSIVGHMKYRGISHTFVIVYAPPANALTIHRFRRGGGGGALTLTAKFKVWLRVTYKLFFFQCRAKTTVFRIRREPGIPAQPSLFTSVLDLDPHRSVIKSASTGEKNEDNYQQGFSSLYIFNSFQDPDPHNNRYRSKTLMLTYAVARGLF